MRPRPLLGAAAACRGRSAPCPPLLKGKGRSSRPTRAWPPGRQVPLDACGQWQGAAARPERG